MRAPAEKCANSSPQGTEPRQLPPAMASTFCPLPRQLQPYRFPKSSQGGRVLVNERRQADDAAGLRTKVLPDGVRRLICMRLEGSCGPDQMAPAWEPRAAYFQLSARSAPRAYLLTPRRESLKFASNPGKSSPTSSGLGEMAEANGVGPARLGQNS